MAVHRSRRIEVVCLAASTERTAPAVGDGSVGRAGDSARQGYREGAVFFEEAVGVGATVLRAELSFSSVGAEMDATADLVVRGKIRAVA